MIQFRLLRQNARSRQLIVVDVQANHIRLRKRSDVSRRSADPAADILKEPSLQREALSPPRSNYLRHFLQGLLIQPRLSVYLLVPLIF